MATEKQKQAARRNLTKARAAQSARAKGKPTPRRSEGMSTAEENGILETAERNAEESIRAFVTTLGFEEVEFVG